jgi:hypothetical protein
MTNPYLYYGLWIYTSLPGGMRKAVVKDFVLAGGQPEIGLKFLVACHNSPEFEAHASGSESLDKWYGHIEAGRVYVKN